MLERRAKGPGTKRRRMHRGLTPEERDAARRRRILDAGIEIFGTRGYAGSRINDICKLARVTARNFYDHFPSREALLLAIYEEIIADVFQAVFAAFETAPTEDAVAEIRTGLTAFARSMASDERRLRINFVEVVGATVAVEARRRLAIEAFRELLGARIEAGEARGLIPPGNDRLTYSALGGAIQESLVDWVSREPRPPLDDVIEELVRIFSIVLLTPRKGS